MQPKKGPFFSLVPEGSRHEVKGEREVMLPGMSLEILVIRKIRLERWNLHQLIDPYWRLYCPTEGRAIIEWEGKKQELMPGQVCLIPPRTTISSENLTPFSKWYAHFILGRSDVISLPGVYLFPEDAYSKRCVETLETARGEPHNWEFASLVLHTLAKLPASAWSDRMLDRRVEKALEFFHLNYSRKISAEDSARAAGVSVRNLNHLFRLQMRLTPMNVLLNIRLDRACHLLRHTDQSVEQVAENCGFPNRYYFSRMLKQHRGISPVAYRKGQLY